MPNPAHIRLDFWHWIRSSHSKYLKKVTPHVIFKKNHPIKSRVGHAFFSKERAFLCVLFKRTRTLLRSFQKSMRSFERSFQKTARSFQKNTHSLKKKHKRMLRTLQTFRKKIEKKTLRFRTLRAERKSTQCPTLTKSWQQCGESV